MLNIPPHARKMVAWTFPNGILTLRGNINLDGQWEFYWHQLLSPTDLSKENVPSRTDWFNIPGRWDGYRLNGKQLKGDGFATFRLKVVLGPDDTPKAIRILNQSSAYTLWVNGGIAAQNGIVGDSRETMKPQYLLQEAVLPPHGGSLDLVLQVSNFNHRKGGVWNPILLGNKERIKKRHAVQWIFDLFLFGSLMMMGVYHICLYLLRRNDLSPLYVALFCLSIAVRILTTGDRYLTVLFPNFPWELLYRIEMLTVTVSVPMLVFFITSLFRNYMPAIIPPLFGSIQLVISLIIILMPAGISGYTVVPNQCIILPMFILILVVLIRAMVKREVSATIILGGFVCLFLTLINDILTTNDAVYNVDLAPFGLFLMILSQSFVLSLRSSRAFIAVESLSRELEKKNIDLSLMDQLKDEFLARTSHELRTPLNGIIGIAESLLSGIGGRMSRRVESNLSMIVSSGRRLSNLVNDILDFSRLKNRDIVLHPRPIDMHGLTDMVLAVSRPLIKGKHLELINAIPENPPLVLGDEDRLQQIMFNLIGNAVKFTDQGEIRVSGNPVNSYLEIGVSDTGMGIPDNKIKDSVVLNSPVLPPLSDAIPAPVKDGFPDPEVDFIKESRILVVDDDPVNLQVVTNHLSFLNISVNTCTNGMSALEKIEAGEMPDLILLDIMMPKMTGYEVCRKLRTRFFSSELPIIMLTAKNLVTDLLLGFEAGANDYLLKPFTGDELIARIKTHLKLREAYHVLRENLSLKNELLERKQTIQELRLLQRRFAEILDQMEDPLIAVNQSHEISFCNDSCQGFLGYKAEDLLGQPISFILPEEGGEFITVFGDDPRKAEVHQGVMAYYDKVGFQTADKEIIQADVRFAFLDLEEENFKLLILREPTDIPEEKAHKQITALKLIEERDRNRNRIQTLEESLNRLVNKEPGADSRLLKELKVMDNALDGLSRSVTWDEDPEDRRRLALEVMNLALAYWTEATGDTKFEMAQRSKIWKVYTNKDGWQRTQTLDKYLAPDVFPQKPRWSRIIETADFVLASCEKTSQTRDHLELNLKKLRSLV